ncbi:MAG: FAD-binding protein, partial [Stackebrandtia sp.]
MRRRKLFAGAGAGAVAVAAGTWGADAVPAESDESRWESVTVRPDDPRYENLLRGNNFRFAGSPDEIRVVGSTEQVVSAVSDAVSSGQRIAVRPGATLGQVYRKLLIGWGVTIPGGGCPEVGAGGHFVGGGYGPLSRRYGSVVDHLYGVEVVVVDADGTARAVVATRDPDDPNHDLWWAHTGAGGGNFGVVTRYWLRSPDTEGSDDPSRLLPAAPRQMLQHVIIWSWEDMTFEALTGLLRNFNAWHERNSAPDPAYTGLYGILQPSHRAGGIVTLVAQIDAGLPDADTLVADFLSEVTADVNLTPVLDLGRTMPWLHRMIWPGSGEPGDVLLRRYKLKAGYLRRSFT